MGWKKTKDLAVGVRKYMLDGQEKTQWANVGEILEDDTGKRMILLDRHFNPAGIPFQEGKSRIAISEFDPKPRDGAQSAVQTPQGDGGVPF